LSLQGAFAELARADGRGALVTVLGLESPGDGADTSAAPGAKLLIRADGGAEGTLGDARLDRAATEHAEELMWAERSELRDGPGGARLFVDVTAPPPRLVIFGAVDFARDLCGMARATGWRPYVVDPRTRFATPERFPDAEEIVAAWPEEAFARLGGIDRATYIAVLTHDPKLDDTALTLALASDAAYVGAMGSRRAQEARRERLLAAGVSEHQLARIAAPIGLDLGGLTGAETALSIMAEVVAVRNGHEGGRLSNARGRIHEVGA
jgi:xanthine dehydrogenase accessory factor